MEIKKADIKDLDTVVRLKMAMFKEVGSIALLQDNAEEKIYAKSIVIQNIIFFIFGKRLFIK